MNFQNLRAFIPELIFRLVIGFIFAESGWGKLQNLSQIVSYFDSLGIPYPQIQAPFVAGVELVAGVFILLGLFTQLSSFLLFIIMVVAIKTAQWEEVTDLSSLFGLSEFLYATILIWLMAFGAKFFSVDVLICKFYKGKTCKLG